MYWFTSDEHYGHKNIIKYCNRPFQNIDGMNSEIIVKHNEVVKENDIVIHIGDFTLSNSAVIYISQLKGKHFFIRGSHDNWMNKLEKKGLIYHETWEKTICGQHIVCNHYPMTIWPRSHHGSWSLYGHVHNSERHKIGSNGKQLNVGVDTNNFYPYSFEQIKELMKNKPDNINLIKESNGQNRNN